MFDSTLMDEILTSLAQGNLVPYLGPEVLEDVKNAKNGEPIPATSESLILSMNNGQPMAPRLMYEFPRAAMNVELKKGRSYLERFLNDVYGQQSWTRAALHDWLADKHPDYVIDINRDTQLLDSYANVSHILILGCARITASDYRFKLYISDGKEYKPVNQESVSKDLPIIFKPMGAPLPEASYVASDADYVDYITELMGGFAIPGFLKEHRKEKQYLLLGMRLNRDTERMILSDLLYDAAEFKGWAVISNASEKEKRFCNNQNIEIVDVTLMEFIQAAKNQQAGQVA